MNYRKISLALLGLVASAAISSASAADLASPGVYFGTGNTNGNFTVSTNNGIEIGQRAIIRYGAQITPVGNLYEVPVGTTSEPGKAGSVWGFTFSVNTNVAGSSPYTLTNTIQTLTLTDALNGTGSPFNLALIPDNEHFIGSPTTTLQNSEALSFTGAPDFATILGDAGYSLWIADTYTFTLDVRDATSNALLATNTIVVNAVPEPLTLSLFAAGLVGAGALRRRKKVQA